VSLPEVAALDGAAPLLASSTVVALLEQPEIADRSLLVGEVVYFRFCREHRQTLYKSVHVTPGQHPLHTFTGKGRDRLTLPTFLRARNEPQLLEVLLRHTDVIHTKDGKLYPPLKGLADASFFFFTPAPLANLAAPPPSSITRGGSVSAVLQSITATTRPLRKECDFQHGNKLLGRFWYCPHALERLAERSTAVSDVEWVIGHGDRYNTLQRGRVMHFSRTHQLAVIFEFSTGTVVTVLPGMTLAKFQYWLAKRDSATDLEKEEAKQKSILSVRLARGQKPLTKKDLRLGTLRVD
jgi:hypothetical protein